MLGAVMNCEEPVEEDELAPYRPSREQGEAEP